jgi:uncharacterized OB-fold protein
MSSWEWFRDLFREGERYFECRECGWTAKPGTVSCSNCGREAIVEYHIR